jgi:apolipoprotein N-acyltransferase
MIYLSLPCIKLIHISWPKSIASKMNPSWLQFFKVHFFKKKFTFILQYRVNWGLSFMIFLTLLSMGLSWSYIPSHRLGRLTRVNSCFLFSLLFFFQFLLSTLCCLRFKLRSFIKFTLYGFIDISRPGSGFGRLNQMDFGHFF